MLSSVVEIPQRIAMIAKEKCVPGTLDGRGHHQNNKNTFLRITDHRFGAVVGTPNFHISVICD